MKSIVAVVITCLAAFCATQNFGDLPSCAINCVGNSIPSTNCSEFDAACICKSSGWIAGLSCCISKNCPPADQQATIQFADQFCQADGVTLPSSASCAASLSTTATGSSSSSEASTAAATTGVSSVTGAAGSTSSSGTVATASTGSSTSAASTASAASTSSASSAASAASVASATPSAGAVHNFVDSSLGVAGVAVAALALL